MSKRAQSFIYMRFNILAALNESPLVVIISFFTEYLIHTFQYLSIEHQNAQITSKDQELFFPIKSDAYRTPNASLGV